MAGKAEFFVPLTAFLDVRQRPRARAALAHVPFINQEKSSRTMELSDLLSLFSAKLATIKVSELSICYLVWVWFDIGQKPQQWQGD